MIGLIIKSPQFCVKLLSISIKILILNYNKKDFYMYTYKKRDDLLNNK